MNSKAVIAFSIAAVGILATLLQKFSSAQDVKPVTTSIYEFKLKGLDGKEADFSSFKGKFMLIVNTASKCGFTPQYAGLQKLHEQFGDRLVVLGFPANNFLWEEPGDNKEIEAFCDRNYGVTFQMFEKISVKGSDRHPLYEWLEAKSGKTPSWNFCKFLIGKDGEFVAYFPSKVEPLDKSIVDKITR